MASHERLVVRRLTSLTTPTRRGLLYSYLWMERDGKYHMLPSGELMILNISRSDAQRTYRCRTHHQLTQEAVVSGNAGRIQLTDIRGPVAPILNEKLVMISAKVDETVVVPCVAYANPRPQYR
uniref:Ig-like domain-containing protein n=1 Tax=Timema cristinae TaxID=61476 RepID=A0A7R9CBB0_TIMCR|nr:unnamed protein product [Timema cristinae]